MSAASLLRGLFLIAALAFAVISAHAQTPDFFVEIDVCDGRDRELRECVDPKPFSMSRNLGFVKLEGTAYEFDFVGRQPGRWHIWAIDGKGQEGLKSPWRTIFYLK